MRPPGGLVGQQRPYPVHASSSGMHRNVPGGQTAAICFDRPCPPAAQSPNISVKYVPLRPTPMRVCPAANMFL